MSRDPELVKKMARLVAEGAAMLAESCPLDGLPLFRLKSGEIVCPVHGRVIIARSEEEARSAELAISLEQIEQIAVRRAREAVESGDPSEALSWLNVAEAAARVRVMRQRPPQEEAKRESRGSGAPA